MASRAARWGGGGIGAVLGNASKEGDGARRRNHDPLWKRAPIDAATRCTSQLRVRSSHKALCLHMCMHIWVDIDTARKPLGLPKVADFRAEKGGLQRTCPPSSASWEGYLHCCASMPRRTAVPVVLLALLASLGGGAKPEPAGSERSPPCGLVVVHPRNLSRPLLDGAGLALRYCTAVPDASCHRLVASCALSSPCRRSGPHAPDAPGRMAGHAAPARH